MARTLHVTRTLLDVLRVLCADPQRWCWGFQIVCDTGVASGTVQPILNRLVARGWVETRWEDDGYLGTGRARRRYMRLTDEGLREARALLRMRG